MSFLDLAQKRYSCRKYLDKEVEPDKIDRCLEAARLAPSACNSQPWHFVIVRDPEQRQKLARAAWLKFSKLNRFTDRVPLFAAIVIERSTSFSTVGGWFKRKPFYLMDIGMAAEHFCLQAAEEGLGSCMLGWFSERRVKKVLKIPFHKRVALLISVGYPEDNQIPEKSRKSDDQIVSYDFYE